MHTQKLTLVAAVVVILAATSISAGAAPHKSNASPAQDDFASTFFRDRALVGG